MCLIAPSLWPSLLSSAGWRGLLEVLETTKGLRVSESRSFSQRTSVIFNVQKCETDFHDKILTLNVGTNF